jgi:hypothetical protein
MIGSQAFGKVSIAAVIDAVNKISKDTAEPIVQLMKESLTLAAPKIPWIIDQRGELDVCQGSPARTQQ